MMSAIVFVVGVVLAIETLAALLSFRDLIAKRGQRAAALEHLVLPTLAIGLVLWIATPAHWLALFNGAAAVVAWQGLAWFVADRAVGRPTFAAQSIDTDDET